MCSISIYGLRCRSCHFQAAFRDDTEGVEQLLALPLSDLVCPKCARASVAYIVHPSPMGPELSIAEMRMAFTGFGLPDEQSVTPELVKELFIEVGVQSVEVARSPANRVLIKSIVFKDGRAVYLCPSGFGVAAFKVTGEADASSDVHEAKESH